MADEELDEKDLKIKALEEELEQHKKLFNIHRAGLQPYLDGIVKEIVSKLHIVYTVSYTHLTLPTNREV